MKREWAAAMTESIHTSTIKNTWETTSLLLLTSWRRTARPGATTTRRGLWASRRAGSSAAMSDGAFSFSLLGQGKGKEEIIVSPWSTRCWARQRSGGCWVKEITNWWTIDSCFLSCLTLTGAIDQCFLFHPDLCRWEKAGKKYRDNGVCGDLSGRSRIIRTRWFREVGDRAIVPGSSSGGGELWCRTCGQNSYECFSCRDSWIHEYSTTCTYKREM